MVIHATLLMGGSAPPAGGAFYIHDKAVPSKEAGGKRNFYHYDCMTIFS
jgi:hypothetical protein